MNIAFFRGVLVMMNFNLAWDLYKQNHYVIAGALVLVNLAWIGIQAYEDVYLKESK